MIYLEHYSPAYFRMVKYMNLLQCMISVEQHVDFSTGDTEEILRWHWQSRYYFYMAIGDILTAVIIRKHIGQLKSSTT